MGSGSQLPAGLLLLILGVWVVLRTVRGARKLPDVLLGDGQGAGGLYVGPSTLTDRKALSKQRPHGGTAALPVLRSPTIPLPVLR